MTQWYLDDNSTSPWELIKMTTLMTLRTLRSLEESGGVWRSLVESGGVWRSLEESEESGNSGESDNGLKIF